MVEPEIASVLALAFRVAAAGSLDGSETTGSNRNVQAAQKLYVCLKASAHPIVDRRQLMTLWAGSINVIAR